MDALYFGVQCGKLPDGGQPDWGRLRAAALRSGVQDCSHRFNSVGLPMASVVTVRTASRFAVRPVLGSATPLKLSLSKLQERRSLAEGRVTKRKMEAARQSQLSEIVAEMDRLGMDRLHSDAGHVGTGRDAFGVKRGHCPACDSCEGFCMPPFGVWHRLAHVCARCGCDARVHEVVDAKERSQHH